MPATPRHLSPPHAAAPGLPCRTPHASHAYPPVAGRSSAWRGSERIASGSVGRTICLWDGRAPGCTATLTHGGGGHQ